MANNTIEHDGVVVQVTETHITVSIQNRSACAACHAKGACGMSEMTQKNIIAEKPAESIKIGDRVIVYASTQNAMLSVLLAYVVPSLLIIISLTLFLVWGAGELLAAILSLAITATYFIVLYLLKNKFAQKIKFKVKIT